MATIEISLPHSRRRSDLWWVALATLGCYGVSVALELHEAVAAWLAPYEHWEADELPLTLAVLACGLAWYAFRRRNDVQAALRLREQAEARASALLARNRELAQQLIALQESERLALARELHDELGQRCSAIRAETAFIRHSVQASEQSGQGSDERAGLLAAARRADSAAQGLYELLSGMLRRLRPANLDELGLLAALQELCEDWEERCGISCIFHHQGMVLLPEDGRQDALNITIYRITQEALTNVMRHAQASSVRVQLACTAEGGLHLTIQDDGRGMDLSAARRGLGLLGAAERAAALGGELQLHSTPGTGLRLGMSLRIARAEALTPGTAMPMASAATAARAVTTAAAATTAATATATPVATARTQELAA